MQRSTDFEKTNFKIDSRELLLVRNTMSHV
jgi:hypothetical protein